MMHFVLPKHTIINHENQLAIFFIMVLAATSLKRAAASLKDAAASYNIRLRIKIRGRILKRYFSATVMIHSFENKCMSTKFQN